MCLDAIGAEGSLGCLEVDGVAGEGGGIGMAGPSKGEISSMVRSKVEGSGPR